LSEGDPTCQPLSETGGAETGEGAEWALKVLNGLIGNARQAQIKGRLESDLSIH